MTDGVPFQEFPTSGVVATGVFTFLEWPRPDDVSSMTGLRNSPAVRRWFIDDTVLGEETNRAWILSETNRPWEAILCIRNRSDGRFLGTIGWTDWDPVDRSVAAGRIAVVATTAAPVALATGGRQASAAFDAGASLADRFLRHFDLSSVRTSYVVGNERAARLNEALGMRIVGRSVRTRPDGSPIEIVDLRMSRQEWQSRREGS
ncbi:MAG: GNAT family protein [bacterium]